MTPVDSKKGVVPSSEKVPEFENTRKWPKNCGNNNKDEENSPKTLDDKNHQASSQKCIKNSVVY